VGIPNPEFRILNPDGERLSYPPYPLYPFYPFYPFYPSYPLYPLYPFPSLPLNLLHPSKTTKLRKNANAPYVNT